MPTRERRLREQARLVADDAGGDVGAAEQRDLADAELVSIVTEFQQEVTVGLEAQAPLRRLWQRWHEVYRARPTAESKDYPYKSASNVVVAVAAEDVERMAAKISQTVFGVEPLWTVKQRNQGYAKYAAPLQRWLDGIRRDVWDESAVIEPALFEVLKLGTSGIYNDWIDTTTYRYDDVLQMTVPAGRTVGPAPRWQPLEDILLPPGYTDVQASPWLGVRAWYSLTRLRELAHAGALDPEAVDEVAKAAPDDVRERRRRQAATQHAQQSVMSSAAASDNAEWGVYGIWTVFFRRDLDGDGYPEEYVVMLHSQCKRMLRFKPNPYPSAMRPLNVLRYIPIEGEFYGLGIPEMEEHAQAEVSTIHNERRDNAHLANMIMFVSDATSNLTDTIRPTQGKNIKVVGGIDRFRQFKVVDNRQADIYEEQVVTDQAHRRVGASELARGNVTSPLGRAAATTVMTAAQEGQQIFDFAIARVRRALGEQGQMVLELYQTHGLPDAGEPGAPEEFLDAPEATLVRELLTMRDTLRGVLKVELTVSTSAINKAVEQQNLVQLYGIGTSYIQQLLQIGMTIGNVAVPPELKLTLARGTLGLDELLRLLFQSFNHYDLETILAGPLVAQLTAGALQQQAIAAGMGMAPGMDPQAANGAAGPPGQVPTQGTRTGPAGAGGSGGPMEPPSGGGGGGGGGGGNFMQ